MIGQVGNYVVKFLRRYSTVAPFLQRWYLQSMVRRAGKECLGCHQRQDLEPENFVSKMIVTWQIALSNNQRGHCLWCWKIMSFCWIEDEKSNPWLIAVNPTKPFGLYDSIAFLCSCFQNMFLKIALCHIEVWVNQDGIPILKVFNGYVGSKTSGPLIENSMSPSILLLYLLRWEDFQLEYL